MAESSIKQYKNGRIYCIRNNINDDVYVGSTTQPLSKRMAEHRSRVKNNTKSHYLFYQKMKELGIENFYIELVEECSCENLEQLRKKEGEYIRKMGTLNRIISGRTDREYQQDNKEKIKENKRLYHLEHQEEFNDKCKKWYEEHRAEVLQKNSEQIECECGVNYTRNHKLRHLDSAVHKKFLETGEKYKPKGEQCECGGFYTRANKAVHIKTQHHQSYLKPQEN